MPENNWTLSGNAGTNSPNNFLPKGKLMKRRYFLQTLAAGSLLYGCTGSTKLADVAKKEQLEKAHLENFDDLDFNVFSGQKWDQLGKSHAQNVIVHWPDGRTTTGIDVHIADLKALFVYAPDTRIKEHPIRIASGEWTAVTGIFEGTFTQPMPIGAGKTIPPTGKPFKLLMATIPSWPSATVTSPRWAASNTTSPAAPGACRTLSAAWASTSSIPT